MSTTVVNPLPSDALPDAAGPLRTVADLINALGGVPAHRIRLIPTPGSATEKDVLDADAHEGRLCELVDGVLVEKPMGLRESLIAMYLIELMGAFVRSRRLGLVAGPDGMLRILPKMIRIPDVSYIRWQRIPGGKIPTEPVPPIAPDLAVEVLSDSNTGSEMERKRSEYFLAGCALVWQIDPDTRTAETFRPDRPGIRLGADQVLEADDLLPGFELPLRDVFAVLDQQAPE
jgi:Uma2 family endonuclease